MAFPVETFLESLRIPALLERDRREIAAQPEISPEDEMELPELSPVSDPPYRKHSLGKLAGVIQRQWSNMPEGVKPYLAALFTLKSVQDRYGFDSGRSIVSQLLSHMAGWKGETAREVKAELRRRLK